MEVYKSLDGAFKYITKNVSGVNTFARITGQSMDEIIRDGLNGITQNDLRYTISLLREDDTQPLLGKAMRDIMENSVLNSLIVSNNGVFIVDDSSAAIIHAGLLDVTRLLLHRSCNQVWQMKSGLTRDIEGGPTNPMFDGVLHRLPGEPETFSDVDEAVAFFRNLSSGDRGETVVNIATLLIDIWQYHWLVIQKTLRELAIVCNHTIPHDVLEAASANVSSMTEIFLVASYLEILDQLVLEHVTTVHTDVIAPMVDVYSRDRIHTDLFKISQSIIGAISAYLQIIADNGNIYLSIEKTDEDYFILDSLMGDATLSDGAVSRWLIERFLEPLQLQLRTWPLCLLFVREFRETMASKMIVLQTLRNRVLPPAVAKAITFSTNETDEWDSAIQKTADFQRKAAAQLLQLEHVKEQSASDRPYSIDVIQSALAIADEFAAPPEKRDIGTAVAHFVEAKEYSVRLRAALYKITDDATTDSMEAKETTIPGVDEWVQKAFFGNAIQSRDRAAAQMILAERGNTNVTKQTQTRLRSMVKKKEELTSAITVYQTRISRKIEQCAKELYFYPLTYQSASRMQRNAARVIARCISDPGTVAREIVASDVLWISQLICSTFPEADNACLTMLQQISGFVVNAPFHLRAFLDRDPVSIVASVSQAERLAASELDQIADTGEATNKIPDAAQDNPWHGWSLFTSEPTIVSPPEDPTAWSSTAKEQLLAAGIDLSSPLVEESRSLGNARFEAGCFAMPNIGLMTGMLQELILRDGNNSRDSRTNLLAYLVLETGWATGRPLNDEQGRMNEMIAGLVLGFGSLGGVSPEQITFQSKRQDWYNVLVFALGMTCIGPSVSSLLATCIGNRLVHQSDGATPPLGVDDPYLTAGIRVLTSKYPQSILPPNIYTRRARMNFGLLLSLRYMQSIPHNEYENPCLDTVAYYANEHAMYVSPTSVSARFAFLANQKNAVDDLLSAISYATPS